MPESGTNSRARRSPDASFCTTHWSVVLAARDRDSSRAEQALADLCQTYWYPLYAYIRRRGNGPCEAEDLTQGFFERLLEKHYLGDIQPGVGRFRSFLLTALNHFLANEWDRGQTRKRGGGRVIFSIDDRDAESRYRYEPADIATPDTLFERRWAFTVLDRVLSRLGDEVCAGQPADLFDHLKPFLSGDPPGASYRDISRRCGIKDGTLRVTVHRLRRRYRELLRAEIGNTVDDPAEIDDEIRHLIAVVGA